MEANELVRVVKFGFGKLREQSVDASDVAGFEVVPGGFELSQELVTIVGSGRHERRDSVTHSPGVEEQGLAIIGRRGAHQGEPACRRYLELQFHGARRRNPDLPKPPPLGGDRMPLDHVSNATLGVKNPESNGIQVSVWLSLVQINLEILISGPCPR